MSRTPTTREFHQSLGSNGEIRVRLTIDRGQVMTFTVQIEAFREERWRPIVRYDSAHDRPHRDLLDWEGNVIDKTWLSPTPTNKQAVQLVIRDLVDNAPSYRRSFLEPRP